MKIFWISTALVSSFLLASLPLPASAIRDGGEESNKWYESKTNPQGEPWGNWSQVTVFDDKGGRHVLYCRAEDCGRRSKMTQASQVKLYSFSETAKNTYQSELTSLVLTRDGKGRSRVLDPGSKNAVYVNVATDSISATPAAKIKVLPPTGKNKNIALENFKSRKGADSADEPQAGSSGPTPHPVGAQPRDRKSSQKTAEEIARGTDQGAVYDGKEPVAGSPVNGSGSGGAPAPSPINGESKPVNPDNIAVKGPDTTPGGAAAGAKKKDDKKEIPNFKNKMMAGSLFGVVGAFLGGTLMPTALSGLGIGLLAGPVGGAILGAGIAFAIGWKLWHWENE